MFCFFTFNSFYPPTNPFLFPFRRRRNHVLSPICQLEEQEPDENFLNVSSDRHQQNNGPNTTPKNRHHLGHSRIHVSEPYSMATSTPIESSGRKRVGIGANNQYFSLRWNNYQSNISSVFYELLESKSFVDVTLACEDHFLKAHKVGRVKLSARPML